MLMPWMGRQKKVSNEMIYGSDKCNVPKHYKCVDSVYAYYTWYLLLITCITVPFDFNLVIENGL